MIRRVCCEICIHENAVLANIPKVAIAPSSSIHAIMVSLLV
jgi:hypothetical protein